MFNTKEKALAKISSLGLPPIFDRIWSANGPKRFCKQWDRPVRCFEVWCEIAQKCPQLESCVPLLESNRDQIVAWDANTNRFIEYHFQDSACVVIGRTYQQLLSSLFVDLGYAGLVDLVEEIADEFEYHHLESFRKFMESDDNLGAEDAKRAFVNSVSGEF